MIKSDLPTNWSLCHKDWEELEFDFSDMIEESFDSLNRAISTASEIVYPDFRKTIFPLKEASRTLF